jgi:tetratricopeptide (TPR) repeat protein
LASQRNTVPLMLEGFDFSTPAIASQLTGALAALKHYNAIRIPPDYVLAFNGRGAVRSDKGDVDGALRDYSEAIRLNPKYALAFNNRGAARAFKGDVEGATEDYNEAIRLGTEPRSVQ